MKACVLCAVIFFLQTGKYYVSCVHDPVVTVSHGKLRGIRTEVVGKKVDAFLGIPYAEPPVGDRRFKVTEKCQTSWNGVRNATNFGHACWQAVDNNSGGFPGREWWTTSDTLSEDCLFLNVWTPYPTPSNAPVFVFIHGGSFHMGASSTELYRGETLAVHQHAVVVSMNYRLGPLGFAAFDTQDEPGNMGLIDQITALEWVKENIEKFGGNPNSVTLIGHSAGAASVGFHLVSPLTRNMNLFHRAILQSGAPNTPWAIATKEEVITATGTLAKDLGCPFSFFGVGEKVQEMLTCLRNKDPQRIIDVNIFSTASYVIIDGALLTENPQISLANNGVINQSIPVIIGTVEEEALINLFLPEFRYNVADINSARDSYSVSEYEYAIELLFFYAINSKSVRDVIAFQYRNWLDPDNGTLLHRSVIDLWEDYCMLCPVKEFVKYYSMTGSSLYAYNFDHRPSNTPYPEWMSTLHADELAFSLGLAMHEKERMTESERQLSDRIMRYWGNFARTGNPNGETTDDKLPVWQRYTAENPFYLTLNTKSIVENNAIVGTYGREVECAFWSELVPKLTKIHYVTPGFHPIFLPYSNYDGSLSNLQGDYSLK
ncbi:cholinesterase-like [Glandiceps talaboti]